jgi:hypothetical protein
MSALTVRGLAEETCLGVRQLAATQGRSVLLETCAAIWLTAWELLALPGLRLAPMPPAFLIASATLPGTPPRDRWTGSSPPPRAPKALW